MIKIKRNKKQQTRNEILIYLIVATLSLIAFKLSPMITGFAVASHTPSTDFTGTFDKIELKNKGGENETKR